MHLIKPFLSSLVTNTVFVAIVLVSAGAFNYTQAWVYWGIGLLLNLGTRVIQRNDPDLAKERAEPGAGAQPWDKKLLGFGLLLNLAMLAAAGLQARHAEEPPRLSWAWFAPGVSLSRPQPEPRRAAGRLKTVG
jgi:hypothetical protein